MFPLLLNHNTAGGTPPPTGPPGIAPQWCWCEAAASTSVQVWWTDRSGDEDQWHIQRSIDNGTTWSDVVTSLLADSSGFASTWKGGDSNPEKFQEKYVDSSAPTNTRLRYRVRGEKTGGSDPTAWAESWHWTVTPPNDFDPAESYWHRVNIDVPICKGDVHTPTVANFQTLLDGGTVDGKTLKRGDIIELDPSLSWHTGHNYAIRKWTTSPSGNRNADFCIIRSKNWRKLPKKNNRVHFDTDSVHMPLMRANSFDFGGFTFDKGANHFWLMGLYFPRWNGVNEGTALIRMYSITGTDVMNDERDAICSHIVIDRCLFDGGASFTLGQATGIEMFADYGAIINCSFRNMKRLASTGQDILVKNCYGPVRIENNSSTSPSAYRISIEGGIAPGMCTADWRIHRNHLFCPDVFNNQEHEFNFEPSSGGFSGLATFSDVQIDVADNTLISRAAAGTFTQIGVGDSVRITAGTGFVTGTYTAKDINDSATTIDLDRSAGTLGSTGGTLQRCTPYHMRTHIQVWNGERGVIENNVLEGGGYFSNGVHSLRFTPSPFGNGLDQRHHWAKAGSDTIVRFNHIKNIVRSMELDCDISNPPNCITLGPRRLHMENNLFETELSHKQFLIELNVRTGTFRKWTALAIRNNTLYVKPKSTGQFAHDNTGLGFIELRIANAERPGLTTGEIIGNIIAVGTYGARVTQGTQQNNGPDPSFDLVFDPAVDVRDNVWINIDGSVLFFPPDDFVPLAYSDVFLDHTGGNFRANNAYNVVSPPVVGNQTKAGADIDTLERNTRGVETGVPHGPRDKVMVVGT